MRAQFPPSSPASKVRQGCLRDAMRGLPRAIATGAAVAAVAVGIVGGTALAAAEPPSLQLPVDCAMGSVCTIQKYVDHDPGPERMDYACGRLSKDGDTGTDFRVPNLPAMEQGVPVVAAAPGVVRATRDGMADISVREIGAEAIRGREAGNGVVIDHGDGWETQYSHLRNGSVAVRQGDRVAAGQRLGLIGMSGNAEFPHTEFSVRYRGEDVDPFVGTAPFSSCGDPRQPLWSEAALAQLAYTPTWLLTAGFATSRPEAEAARRGAYDQGALRADADALVMWADVSGTIAGDVQSFRIEGPDGAVVHEHSDTLKDNNISWFAFSGRRPPGGSWQPGRYRGTYTLTRDGTALIQQTREVVLE